MNLFSLTFVYLGAYYGALARSFWRTRSTGRFSTRNSLVALALGGIGPVLIVTSSVLAPSGAAALVIMSAVALVPIFLLGLGSLLGAWIAQRRTQPVALLVGLLALVWPLYFALELHTDRQNRAVEAADLETRRQAFQQSTITGRLGRYPIKMPASPQIDTYYSCFDANTGLISQCHTLFDQAPGLRNVPGEVPIFHTIAVAAKDAECEVPCIGYKRLITWCGSRSDVALTEWCRTEPADALVFSYDENRSDEDLSRQNWVALPSNNNVTLHCRKIDQSETCRATYDIARNLQAQIWMTNADRTALNARIANGKAYADRLWAALQAR